MFNYCCAKPQIEKCMRKDINNLRNRIDEMKKQINNIYELLEALTNESKKKPTFIIDKDDMDKWYLFLINIIYFDKYYLYS